MYDSVKKTISVIQRINFPPMQLPSLVPFVQVESSEKIDAWRNAFLQDIENYGRNADSLIHYW
jgi:hypothetical protein